MPSRIELRRGERIRVRSAAEILVTLDGNGDLDGLPFMPEMLKFAGKSLTVQARSDKTCDTVNQTGCSREMDDTVHLVGARCDGSAHGGCQAGCLLFFKEAWIERSSDDGTDDVETPAPAAELEALAANTMTSPEHYRCQATRLPEATRELAPLKHFVRDLTTRNVPVRLWVRGVAITAFDRFQAISRGRLPKFLRIRNGDELPVVRGTLTKTPVDVLDLQPGERVVVKSLPEIRATLNANQMNRNLWYDRELVKYCGKELTVAWRIDRLLDEKSGKMLTMKTPAVVLEGAICVGDFHKLCPRQAHNFFREIWLRRVSVPGAASR